MATHKLVKATIQSTCGSEDAREITSLVAVVQGLHQGNEHAKICQLTSPLSLLVTSSEMERTLER